MTMVRRGQAYSYTIEVLMKSGEWRTVKAKDRQEAHGIARTASTFDEVGHTLVLRWSADEQQVGKKIGYRDGKRVG